MPRLDRATRDLAADPSAVFRAFLDADELAAWLPPEGMTGELVDADLREGGGFTMELTYDQAESDSADVRGKTTADTDVTRVEILETETDRRIVWGVDFESDDPAYAGRMTMTWTFTDLLSDPGEDERPGTRVAVDCTDVPAGIDPDSHQAGLNASLANLARRVED
ncbi:MAG: SRPBCC domain-containing protein [Nocardioides sp.]